MGYGRPLKIDNSTRRSFANGSRQSQGRMPVYGTNLKDNSQLLDTRYALRIENYLVHGVANMQKRPGSSSDFDTGETTVIVVNDEYRYNYDVEAYGQKVRLYNNVTKTFTDIKTDFSPNNGGFTGGRYGDYFFINNIVDGLWRISPTLGYKTQTANFTVGTLVTGATSGARATILEDLDSGATGTLTLGSITGTFVDGEIITDTTTGSATVNGVLTFAITSVPNAPKAGVFRIIGKRAILVRLASDDAGYNYSAADTTGNPPFTNWTVGTGINDPGKGSNRNGGTANDACLIGDQIFIGQQKGWYAFKIVQTVLQDGLGATISSKYDQEVATREKFPIFRCVMTNAGMLVNSTSGVYRLVSLGQPNIPYSDQWENLTDDLGEDFFNDVDWSRSDIMLDMQRSFIYATLSKDSAVNNLVLAIKVNITTGGSSSVKTGASSFFTAWNIRKFLVREDDSIFATSDTSGTRRQYMVGQKDVNSSIHSEYLQELNFGFNSAFKMNEFYAYGGMSPASQITVSFDTFDEKSFYTPRAKVYEWIARNAYNSPPKGWGTAGFGQSGWGGGSLASGLIPDYTGAKPKLRQVTRVYLRFESDDFAEHVLNWFTADVQITKMVRNRNLNEII